MMSSGRNAESIRKQVKNIGKFTETSLAEIISFKIISYCKNSYILLY